MLQFSIRYSKIKKNNISNHMFKFFILLKKALRNTNIFIDFECIRCLLFQFICHGKATKKLYI